MSSEFTNKKVLLGVTGGIAAYKAVDLASKMTSWGIQVSTIMTANACRLVGPKSFEAITGNAVYIDMWSSPRDHRISHINLVDWADVVVVAPATANMISKYANGICDDLLSTTLCVCWEKPKIFAPAMNSRMWHNPAVRKNLETIIGMNSCIVGPGEGRLACGDSGPGRMSEPEMILASVKKLLSK